MQEKDSDKENNQKEEKGKSNNINKLTNNNNTKIDTPLTSNPNNNKEILNEKDPLAILTSLYENRFSKIDKTLHIIMKMLKTKFNLEDFKISQSNVAVHNNTNNNEFLQKKTSRNEKNEVIRIKEEDTEINDSDEKEKDVNSNESNDSKKSTGDEKSYKKGRKDEIKNTNKTYNHNSFENNINSNIHKKYSIEANNCAPTLKNSAIINSNLINNIQNGKEKVKSVSKINKGELTKEKKHEKFIEQYTDIEQEQQKEKEKLQNKEKEKEESPSKYKEAIKKKSFLSKNFKKKYKKKKEESSYSPPNYATRKVSQSMINYSKEVEYEEQCDEDLLEKEKREREKIRDKEREKVKENKKIVDFKYYFDGHIINNKKIRWEVKIKQLSGWFSIGIGERTKTSQTNEKQNHTVVIVDKEYITNKINFLLTNDHCTIMWGDGKNNINRAKGSFNIKEGDTLLFTYSPKFNNLKIQKNNSTYVIENIDYYSDQWLVPCAIFSRKNDKAIFKNFHVLADYNNKNN